MGGFLADMQGIISADASSGSYSSSYGTDFYNTNLANSDILKSIDSGITNSVSSTIGTPTFAPSTYGGPSVVNPSGTPSLVTTLENLIPSAFNTAAGILKTQYSVPQTSPGQYFVNGQMSTGTLAPGQASILGANASGQFPTWLLLVGLGLAVFLVAKK